MIVAETMLLDRGVNIYNRPTPDLFIAAPYPPLFYLLNWPVQHLAGDEPTFKGGRALSVLATLLVGVAITGIATALTGHRLAGAVGAGAWWGLYLVVFWGTLVKPDMLALALGLGGLWWLVARPQSAVWWTLPLFLAAFYTKQTAIAAGVAATGWLLITRPRTGLAFGAALALGAVVPTLALDRLTAGGYFYHIYTIHDLPWFPQRFALYMTRLLSTYGALLIPGMLAIVVTAGVWLHARVRRWPDQHEHGRGSLLMLFYLLMAFAASSGAGTHGGNHNHLLELTAASCVGLGLGLAQLLASRWWQLHAVGALLGLFLLAQVPSLFAVPEWMKAEFSWLNPAKTEGMMNIFQYVTNNGGTAYSDNVGLLLLTRKKLWTTDPFTQTHATLYGRWDESKLVGVIRSGYFDQIIVRVDVSNPADTAGDLSPAILQAIRDNYRLDRANVENIYIPKGK
jgi:MFS family permease